MALWAWIKRTERWLEVEKMGNYRWIKTVKLRFGDGFVWLPVDEVVLKERGTESQHPIKQETCLIKESAETLKLPKSVTENSFATQEQLNLF